MHEATVTSFHSCKRSRINTGQEGENALFPGITIIGTARLNVTRQRVSVRGIRLRDSAQQKAGITGLHRLVVSRSILVLQKVNLSGSETRPA